MLFVKQIGNALMIVRHKGINGVIANQCVLGVRKMFIEQTEIAKKLGISNKSFRRFAYKSGLDKHFKIIAKKRWYDFEQVGEYLKNYQKTLDK